MLKSIVLNKMKTPYADTYADFSSTGYGKVYDYQVAEFAMKHLKPWDWLNPYKVTVAINTAFYCLQAFDEDPEKNWKELFDY